jgi:site-specific recombinase XerD
LEKNPFDNIQKRKEDKKLPRTLNKEQLKEIIYNLENAFDIKTFT